MRITYWLNLLLALVLTPLAPGQSAEDPDGVPPPPEPTPAVTLELAAGVWYPRLGGKSTLGDSATRPVSLESHFDLDDSVAVFNAELTIAHKTNWQTRFSGFDFSTDDSGRFPAEEMFGDLALMEGSLYNTSLKMFSLAGEVGLNLFPNLGISTEETSLRLMPELGVRYFDVEQSVELVGVGREDPRGEWFGLTGGLMMCLDYEPPDGMFIGRSLRIEGGGAIGPAFGGDGGYLWSVRAGATLYVTDGLGVMLGYRLLELDVEDGDWEFDGGLQGLYLAGTIRF